jgi:hypothetical protein
MAHISSIGAAMFTDLAVAVGSVTSGVGASPQPGSMDATGFQALFATEAAAGPNAFVRVKNVRDFPSIGTPANIVNVPVYGQTSSQTVQGQADAPSLEVTVNYIPNDWTKGATGTALGNMVGDATMRAWRMTLLQTDSTGATALTKYASIAGGLGTVANSQFYFLGKLESLLVNPSLTDATTATLAFSMQSAFFGPYTI